MYTSLAANKEVETGAGEHKKRPQTIGEITLKPGEDAKIPLGSYNPSQSEPTFAITYSPGTRDDVKGSLVKISDDDKGTYHLIYFFQSFCDKTSRVTVQRITE